MTVDEAIAAYAKLTSNQQVLVLVNYAHRLTIVARDAYIPDTEDISNPRLLRQLNEIQHRVIGQIRSLLTSDGKAYPDDLIVRMAVRQNEQRLLAIFSVALPLIGATFVK